MSAITTPLPETTAAWTLPVSREGRHGVSHLRRVRHLHDFRGGLSLLRREEPHRTDSARSAGNADLLHHLSVVQQSDDPLRGKISGARQTRRIPAGSWLLTIVLGALFLYGTGQEWHRLIYEHGLTISTNLFGTTYYSLVGLHAFHVTAGLIMLSIVLLFGLAGRVGPEQSARVDVLSLYWHFVDAVWVVVFTVVYVLGR